MTALTSKLQALLDAYKAKGYAVETQLQPGLIKETIIEKTQWFPITLPESLIEMYQWHNGNQNWQEKYTYSFRDMSFISLETAKQEYENMLKTCNANSDLIDLKTCFPFATYNQEWYVLPCAEQKLNTEYKMPVIEVFHDIKVYFYSLESMLDTCIEWVNQFGYETASNVSDEMIAWKKYNPGIDLHGNDCNC